LDEAIQAKIKPLFRPPMQPFTDDVFEYIKQNMRPLKHRAVDLLFEGDMTYWPAGLASHPVKQRQLLADIWDTLPGFNKRFNADGITSNDFTYVDALLDARVVISPWGWAPWCPLDFAALACGCVLIKPMCVNIVTYPDIYDPEKQLIVWSDVMFEGLADQLSYCYANLPEMQDRADRGHALVLDTLYPNMRLYEHWTTNMKKIVEDAVNHPNYSQAVSIPDTLY